LTPLHIAVCVTASGDLIHRISLKLSSQFELLGDHCPSFSEWLEAYLAGIPIPFKGRLGTVGTPFQRTCWEMLSRIPFGSTRSYGQIAQQLGIQKTQRAVGGACNKNPWPLLIPCHRVVQAQGIGGFAFDLEIKKRLLSFESGV